MCFNSASREATIQMNVTNLIILKQKQWALNVKQQKLLRMENCFTTIDGIFILSATMAGGGNQSSSTGIH